MKDKKIKKLSDILNTDIDNIIPNIKKIKEETKKQENKIKEIEKELSD